MVAVVDHLPAPFFTLGHFNIHIDVDSDSLSIALSTVNTVASLKTKVMIQRRVAPWYYSANVQFKAESKTVRRRPAGLPVQALLPLQKDFNHPSLQ